MNTHTITSKKSVKKLSKFNVILQLKFIRKNRVSKENNPRMEELDKYMKGKFNGIMRYKQFIANLYEYGVYDRIPSKIKYLGDGKIQYEIVEMKPRDVIDAKGRKHRFEGDFRNEKEVKDNLEMEASGLADGMWEGEPGSEGVYPTSDGLNELGVIGIDLKKTKVEKI